MALSFMDKVRRMIPFLRRGDEQRRVLPLPFEGTQRLVRVFVEGYDDVAFWRGIFDHFQNPYLRFEISVPNREDLPKGKKVLLSMAPGSGEDFLLCMDSDFDYLMNGANEQSRTVNGSPYLFHTYAYATENYLCYAPSLHNVCVKATKNDTHIFDFDRFLTEYSRRIYPVFLWYVYSANRDAQHNFTLVDFKNTVRLGYLDLRANGEATLQWVGRNVERCCRRLAEKHPEMADAVLAYGAELSGRGLRPENVYLFMHGHTLLDNVVMVLLQTVCEQLRRMTIEKIRASKKRGTAFNNEISNYKNAQRSIRDVLLDNENYTRCPLYGKLQRDIERYIVRTIIRMKRRGEIRDDSFWTILRRLRNASR